MGPSAPSTGGSADGAHRQANPVVAGCATEFGFTRVRQYHCPSPQHPAWMRRPEIHTPDGGYGIRASLAPVAPQMTGVRFCGRDQLLISADQVFSINLTTESGIGMLSSASAILSPLAKAQLKDWMA